jgi:hydrogenase maturation protease
LETTSLPGVTTMACHQLMPEQAESIASARAVVFVDACLEADVVTLARLDPSDVPAELAHRGAPADLLALALQLYGDAPPAWWIRIPVQRLAYVEGLSRETALAAQTAVAEVFKLWERTARYPCSVKDKFR